MPTPSAHVSNSSRHAPVRSPCPQCFTDVQIKLSGEAAATLGGAAPETPAPTAADQRPQSASAAEDAWSDVQNVALVKAVKTFPKARRDSASRAIVVLFLTVEGKRGAAAWRTSVQMKGAAGLCA